MVSLHDPLDLILLFFSSLQIGSVFIPVSAQWKKKGLEDALDLTHPDLVITDRKTIKSLAGSDMIIKLYDELKTSSTDGIPEVFQNPDDVCLILFTSGTTAKPKAVQLTYNNLKASADAWNHQLEFVPDDRYLACLPLNHAGGLGIFIRAVLYGFTVILNSGFDAKKVIELINREQVTLISLVPTMLKRLMDTAPESDLPGSLRKIILGGGPINADVIRNCTAKGIPLLISYGMTETASGISGWNPTADDLNRTDWETIVGKPFSSASIAVENSQLVISGPMVMKGYLNEPDCHGVHRSGDFGWINENNYLHLDSRREDLIISGGENVDPGEIEAVIQSSGLVEECCVIGISDDEWGQRIAAFIVPVLPDIDISEVADFCRNQLAEYKIPKDYISIKSLPKNEMGKLSIADLKQLYKDLHE